MAACHLIIAILTGLFEDSWDRYVHCLCVAIIYVANSRFYAATLQLDGALVLSYGSSLRLSDTLGVRARGS